MSKPKTSRGLQAGTVILMAAGCKSLWGKAANTAAAEHPLVALVAAGVAILTVNRLITSFNILAAIRFIWNCFMKPVRGKDQNERLDSFYKGQANVYDATRNGLLQGRDTMLKLVAGHWKIQSKVQSKLGVSKRRIWVDIGGGTGWNIEQMDEFMPLASFDAIYLVDLCKPLLEVAEQRFRAKGWKNVHCLHQDASKFTLPEWESGNVEMEGSVSVVTMSYSMSMIPTYEKTLERAKASLTEEGIIGVVDFYTTSNPDPALSRGTTGTRNLKCGTLNAWFWKKWFSYDHVHLGQERRVALQSRFETLKCINGRNKFIVPQLIRIPYYIFLGVKEASDAPQNEAALQRYGLWTPESPFSKARSGKDSPPEFSLGASSIDQEVENMLSSRTSEQNSKSLPTWRIPYSEQAVHKQFRTHIYGWTWEDPFCDIEKLNIHDGDRILCITSAGDNVLHYATKANVEIESVDMNPCQGHILELKLAAIQGLDYHEFWAIFGEGKHPNFEYLLDTKIAPYLSAPAYAYWKDNANEFADCFFLRGYSGWAIRLASVAFRIAGVSGDVKKMINSATVAEQERIWHSRLRPVIFNPLMKLILATPFFCWNALGVPKNQLNCLLEDGSVEDFMVATMDPIPGIMPLKHGGYHYFLCMNGKYTRSSCPLYLTPEGFSALKNKASAKTRGIRMHTDTILNVLRGLQSGSLTKIIVMDSLDWFDPIPDSHPLPVNGDAPDLSAASPEKALEDLRSELDYEILEMRRVLAPGGHAIWRSAGKYPWYRRRFEKAGFELEAVDIRENGQAIDRVNMYASLWRAIKVTDN